MLYRSSVEFNRYTYSAITSVINPKVINNILELLDFRYAIKDTTARNCEMINDTRCNKI